MPLMCFKKKNTLNSPFPHAFANFQLNSRGYANLATAEARLQENNAHRPCNLMLSAVCLGAVQTPILTLQLLEYFFWSWATWVEKLYLSFFPKHLTSILLMVVTKKLSEIQFPFSIINLLNAEKKVSHCLMLHKGIIQLRILNIKGFLHWIKIFSKEQRGWITLWGNWILLI